MASPAPPTALTKNYELIYRIVQRVGLGTHLTMNEVYARAAVERPGIGFSTVYRGLVRLRELGLIAEIVVPGGESATYEPIGPPHAHFRCRRCGRIEDVAYNLSPRVLRTVASAHDFEVAGGTVTFEGRCRTCAADSAAAVT
ncbi:MAG: Fur family transcriptional regulator [Vulcanimicrobiaceae bacterium]